MILEVLTATITPTKTAHEKLARRMGYLYEAVGISARHTRCFRAWRPHLKACKKAIKSAISQVPSTGKIVILGSGAWLDMPVRALAKHGAEIMLVDMVHLPAARLRARLIKNFTLVNADLTGLAQAWDAWDEDAQSTPIPPTSAPLPIDSADLVISLNILSQLPLAFLEVPPVSEAESHLMVALQRSHMNALKAHGGQVLVISDFERIESRGKELDLIQSVQPGILSSDPLDKWSWHIAPKGEVDRKTDISMTVGCWTFAG